MGHALFCLYFYVIYLPYITQVSQIYTILVAAQYNIYQENGHMYKVTYMHTPQMIQLGLQN